MTKLDLSFVRAQFPAFSQANFQGQAFFENAGGSYACAPVIDRLTRFYRQRKVQPYGPYPAAQAGGAEMDEARSRLAALMGVKPDTVAHRKEMLHMMRAKGAGGQAGCGLLHLGQCRQKPRIGRKFFQRHQDLAAHLRRTTRSDLGLCVAQHFVDVDAHIGLWMTFVLD